MTEPFARERVLAREWCDGFFGDELQYHGDVVEQLAHLLHSYGEECRQAMADEKLAKGRKR